MKKLSDCDYRRENFKSESRIDLITLHRCQHLNSSSLRTSLLPFSPCTERLRLNTDVLILIARLGVAIQQFRGFVQLCLKTQSLGNLRANRFYLNLTASGFPKLQVFNKKSCTKASKFLNCPPMHKAGENSFRAHDLNLEGYKIKCTLAYKIFSTLKNP